MAILKPDTTTNLGGVTVNEYLLTKYNPNRIAMPSVSMEGKVIGVTMHNTDWISVASGTTPAEQYTRATVNGNMNDVRVHYYVDNICAWQNLPLNLSGWHAADGNGNGNRRTIAIECIMSSAYNDIDKKSEDNAAKLAAALLKKYNFNIDHLYTHTHWLNVRDGKSGSVDELNTMKHSYKMCPLYILPHWSAFKAKVKSYLDALNGKIDSSYTKTLSKGTPIYKEIGKTKTSEITVASTYTIVEEKIVDSVKYGKLKSGVGWVELEKIKKTYSMTSKNDIKSLQNALNAKGYNCGAADGIIGDNTIKAMFNALCEFLL